MANYILPSHPSLKSTDPLGITDVDEPTIWEVIVATLSSLHTKSLWDLPDLIESLGYSVHGKGTIDTKFLRSVLAEAYPDPYEDTPQTIFREIIGHALALPGLYPEHTFIHLSEAHPIEILTPQQVKCLVAHQLLGTLTPPIGNTWGCTFTIWYTEHQPLKDAVHGYLSTLFHFFLTPNLSHKTITYRYHTAGPVEPDVRPWGNCDVPIFDYLKIETATAESVKFPHDTLKCMLVASNRFPGFGASCTQEELVTGACPELLPLGALFVSPPVPDNAVLVAQGVTPMSRWTGRGRDAQVVEYLDIKDEYTFLLLDASELDHDSSDGLLLDLVPTNLPRDLEKAHAGFSALRAMDITEIASPLWGAGAFGGDPIVKAFILGMAGARNGVKVSLLVDTTQAVHSRTGSHTSRAIDILNDLKENLQSALTVQHVWTQFNSPEARACLDGYEVARLL